ncbi:autotransporter domain-containing protein [Sphingobium sp. JS3065]|uniref:autotransporter outer membrane beta-barrel domain-containing protein n=1 Tax=Sphingobium sp. JS3065 TaxID=2970925 RepID=UPI002263D46A|nr:autotransporter outer membrane beta-barrel domain-containing protein [Sphingobium sp. JS3065]UZW57180.1 autotransporter domain-containing protein [Sphingobium sp. JS3065]
MIGRNSMRSPIRLGLAMGVSLFALGTGSAFAQFSPTCPDGSAGPLCLIGNTDSIGPIGGTLGTAIVVNNSGTISGDPAITAGQAVVLSVTNATGGVIGGGVNAIVSPARTGIPLLSFNISNAGTINGNVSYVEPTPVSPQNPLPGALYYYISDGGTLNGNLQLGTGFSSANFIQRGADDGVTGTISAGGGIDIYTRSYSQTQSLELGARTLPTSFEIEGFEVRGGATTVTLTGQGTTISLMGDGHVVNNGTINLLDTAGLYPQGVTVVPAAINYYQQRFATFQRAFVPPGTVPLYTPAYGDALASFVNEGTVNGDIRIATASFANNDEINLSTGGIGSVITTSAGEDFAFANAGTIEMTFNGQRSPTTNIEREFDEGVNAAVRIRQALETTTLAGATIGNSGSIVGGLDANVAADIFSFTNSGLIAGIDASGYFQRGLTLALGELDLVLPDANDEFNADSATIVNTVDGEIRDGFYAGAATQNLRFENHGRIAASAREGGTALLIETGLLQDDGPGDDDVIDIPAESFAFTNSGTIDGAVEIEIGNRVATFDNSGVVTRTELAIDQDNRPLFGGVAAFDVESETDVGHSIAFNNSGSIVGQDRGGSGLFIETEAGDGDEPGVPTADSTITLVNSGTIKATGGATVAVLNPNTQQLVVNQIAAVGIDQESSGAGVVTIENREGGLIEVSGTPTLLVPTPPVGDFVYSPVPNGVNGAMATAIGVAGKTVNIVNAGIIRGGAGSDYSAGGDFIIDNALGQPNRYLAGAIHTSGDQLDDDSGFLPSTDHVTNAATGVIIGSIDLNAGDDRIDNAGQISGDIYMREGDDTIVNAGVIAGTVRMGDGNDSFIHLLASAVQNGTVDGGAGEDTLSFDITGTTYTGSIDPALRNLFTGFEVDKIIGTGQVVVQQTVEVASGGPLNLTEGSSIVVAPGETAISGGATSVSVSNSGEVVGNVDLGGGDNVLTNMAGGSITGNIVTGDGANMISNQGGTITGNVTAGSGADSLVNSGAISGDVDLGAGADMLTIGTGGSFGGTVAAGGGTDVLAFNTGSSYAEQTTIDGSSFTGFEQLNNSAGVNGFTGNLDVETVNVTGGRLIGQAGSTLTGTVEVASGGTFGTAGAVNGDVTIGTGATLSPGASPGIMTINGNLTIANGTTTTFEFVPVGQSDQIVVNGGSVSIGDNTTVNLTGSLTPGASRDLIVVNGGGTISGEFDIVNRDPGIVGVLRNNGATLQLLGTFVAPTGVTSQTDAAIDYVNDLLIAGTASASLIDAVPLLLSGGTANAAAFGQLTPEAYASASQLGVEQGLALARAGRAGLAATTRETAGPFTFAQGLGGWRTLKGDGATGTATAKSHSYGVVGGIGFGNANGSIGAFVGYVDSRQTLLGRGARTNSDGVVAGLTGHFQSGGFEGTATVAYDWSEASTRRAVPGAATALSGDYRLRSLVLDGTLGYSFPMGGWAVRPEVGVTHVATRRGATTETGSAAFALAVDRAKTSATFIDGGIRLKDSGDGAGFHPWAALGVRHQLEGERSTARAGFVGNAARFTALGAGRKETMATAGAGVSYDLGTGLSLYGAYQGEFGGGRSHNVNVGVRFAF